MDFFLFEVKSTLYSQNLKFGIETLSLLFANFYVEVVAKVQCK